MFIFHISTVKIQVTYDVNNGLILSDVSSASLCKDLQDHIHGNSIIQCTSPNHRLAVLQLYHGVVADSHGDNCHDGMSETCVRPSFQSLLDSVKSDCDVKKLGCIVQSEWFQEPESCPVTGSLSLTVDYTCVQGKIWLKEAIHVLCVNMQRHH